MRFATAFLALEWAETIISIREGGRSNAAMLELLGTGGVCKDYALLDAYQIRKESEKACRAGMPCPYRQDQCLFNVYLPDPTIQYPEPSESERKRQEDCMEEFARLLKIKGFLSED